MKNLELSLRFLIHSNDEQIQDDLLTDLQKTLEGNLMVDIKMPETNILKNQKCNMQQQEVILIKRSAGKIIQNTYFEDLKPRLNNQQ